MRVFFIAQFLLWSAGCSQRMHRRPTNLSPACETEFLKSSNDYAKDVIDKCFEMALTQHKSMGVYSVDSKVKQSDFKVVRDYIDGWAYKINKALRLNDKKFLKQNLKKKSNLDKSLKNFPIYRGIVFRGSEFPPAETLFEGKVFQDKAYLSTSRDATVAESYAGKKGYFSLILSRTGRTLAYDKSTRDLSLEKEVLFPRESSFKVYKIQKGEKNHLTVVFLIEIVN